MEEAAAVRQRNTLSLAFLGDAVYELLVREYIMEHSGAAPGALHRLSVAAVRASAQCAALGLIEEYLDEEERAVVRRGRNSSKASAPRGARPRDYRAATALEALFGYLSMAGRGERAALLFGVISKNQIDGFIETWRQTF